MFFITDYMVFEIEDIQNACDNGFRHETDI